MSRRRADAERSITAILDAALTCFANDPAVSMAEIAQAAGVGRVTLYSHFGSREILLQAAVTRAIAEATTFLADAVDEKLPADQAMAELVRTSWRTLDTYGGLGVAAIRHLDPEWLRKQHQGPLQPAADLIARGREEGVFRTDVPAEWQLTVCYSVIHAAAMEVDAGRLAAGDAGRILEVTVLGALRGQPAS